jgi:DNA-binding XRE family transcriptional regulator
MIQTDPDDEILATDIDEGEVDPPPEEETQDLVPLRPKKTKAKKGKGKKSAKKSAKVKAKKEPKAKKARAAKPKAPKKVKAPKAEKPASGDSSKKPRGCGRRLDGKPRRAFGTNPPKTEATKKFGAKVRKMRKDLGLTQSKLAADIGVHQSSIANIESGVARAGEAMAERMLARLTRSS